MSKGKPWKRIITADEMAFGVESAQSVQHFTVPSATATAEELASALQQAYETKGFNSLPASKADQLFAEMLGVKLRVDDKGRKLALQREDLPPKADWKVTVTVLDRNSNPVERRLGGTVRHNRALGLARAAGRIINSQRKPTQDVQAQAQLLGMELNRMQASEAEKKQVFSAFWAPYRVRVDIEAAKSFLKTAEPEPKSRKAELRASLTAESVARVDELLNLIKK